MDLLSDTEAIAVPSRDRKTSAKFLADLLDVGLGESFGIFSAVYVNSSLTIDFMDSDRLDEHHYFFQ